MTTAAIYLRLSKDDGRAGESMSIEGQRADCTAYAKRQGWSVVEFKDDGYSASKDVDRPQFNALLDAMAAGEVAAVVAAKQDRLTRKGGEWQRFRAAAALSGVEVHTVEAGDLGLATDTGILNTDIRSAFAEFEARVIGSRTRRGLETARDKGQWTNTATFGYSKGGVINHEQARWVRWAYNAILNDDMSTREVFERFRAEGVKTARGKDWYSVNTVIQMLKVPALAGLVTYKGEVIGQGAWEPIVTPEERERLIATISARATSSRAHGERTPRRYALAGLVLCGNTDCDLRTMVAQNPGSGRQHNFYCDPRKGGCKNRCKGGELTTLAETVAGMFLNEWEAPEVEPVAEWDDTEAREVESEIAAVRSMVATGDMRASDGAPILRGLNARLEALRAAEAEHEVQVADVFAWHRSQRASVWDQGDPERLRRVLDNVVCLPDGAGFLFESKVGQTRKVVRALDTGAWLLA